MVWSKPELLVGNMEPNLPRAEHGSVYEEAWNLKSVIWNQTCFMPERFVGPRYCVTCLGDLQLYSQQSYSSSVKIVLCLQIAPSRLGGDRALAESGKRSFGHNSKQLGRPVSVQSVSFNQEENS